MGPVLGRDRTCFLFFYNVKETGYAEYKIRG